MENKKEKSFEELVTELNEVIKKLENNDISLDDAVKNYTNGVELSKKCYQLLDKNEKLVTLKMTEAGLEEFNEE